jgi:hypothetical protein
MAFEIRPFLPHHVREFKAQIRQIAEFEHVKALEESGWFRVAAQSHAWTGFNGTGVLGFAGLIPHWQGRAVAWCVLGDGVSRRNIVAVHSAVTRGVTDAFSEGIERIEMTVDADFEAGHRWARLLGFTVEGRMRRYFNGRDHFLYARVKDDPAWQLPPSSR